MFPAFASSENTTSFRSPTDCQDTHTTSVSLFWRQVMHEGPTHRLPPFLLLKHVQDGGQQVSISKERYVGWVMPMFTLCQSNKCQTRKYMSLFLHRNTFMNPRHVHCRILSYSSMGYNSSSSKLYGFYQPITRHLNEFPQLSEGTKPVTSGRTYFTVTESLFSPSWPTGETLEVSSKQNSISTKPKMNYFDN